MLKRCAIYTRVSTVDKNQTTENQKRELTALAAQRQWTVVGDYEDAASGSKGRDQRPGLDAMLKDADRGRFDVVLVWAIDRLGRSLTDLVSFLKQMSNVNVQIVVLQQGMDTTTPGGVAMFQMVGVFAEFERSMIQARVKAGIQRVKADEAAGRPRYDAAGNRKKKLGKQPLSQIKIKPVIQALADGVPKSEIARSLGVSLSSVQRISRGTEVRRGQEAGAV